MTPTFLAVPLHDQCIISPPSTTYAYRNSIPYNRRYEAIITWTVSKKWILKSRLPFTSWSGVHSDRVKGRQLAQTQTINRDNYTFTHGRVRYRIDVMGNINRWLKIINRPHIYIHTQDRYEAKGAVTLGSQIFGTAMQKPLAKKLISANNECKGEMRAVIHKWMPLDAKRLNTTLWTWDGLSMFIEHFGSFYSSSGHCRLNTRPSAIVSLSRPSHRYLYMSIQRLLFIFRPISKII